MELSDKQASNGLKRRFFKGVGNSESEHMPLYGRGLSESPLIEGLRGPSMGITRLGLLAGLGEYSSSKACFNHRFLQEPEVGGVSGISRDRRLPVGTPGVVGLRLARNGEEKRT